jgi:hypothetical protein
MSDSTPPQPPAEDGAEGPLNQATPSQLELVDDDITPGQHTQWDEQLMEPYSESPIIPLKFLLSEIVETCDKMNRALEDPSIAGQFIQSHPEVAKELENAWNSKQFKRIRLISKLFRFFRFLYFTLCLI